MPSFKPMFYKLNEDKTTSPFINFQAFVEYVINTDPVKFHEEHIVGLDKLDTVRVSTVFSNVPLDIKPTREPILFETRITGGRYDKYRFRYATWQEALAGHRTIVSKLSTDPDAADLSVE